MGGRVSRPFTFGSGLTTRPTRVEMRPGADIKYVIRPSWVPSVPSSLRVREPGPDPTVLPYGASLRVERRETEGTHRAQ